MMERDEKSNLPTEKIDEKKSVPKDNGPSGAEKANVNDGKQVKKSRRGCCIGILAIFVLYVLFNVAAFGFFGGSDKNDFIPEFIPLDKVSTIVPGSGNKTPTEPNGSDSNKSTNKQTTNDQSSSPSGSESESNTLTPADNVTSTSSQPPAGSQELPADGAEAPTTFTKQQQIDFFVQVAMKNDQNGFATVPIQKWRTNPGTTAKVRYYNNPTGLNLSCADQTISQINALSNTIHFSKTTGNDYNVRVYFVPKSQIGAGIGGYYNYSTDASHYVTGGNAYVPSDTYADADRCHYIRHEMIHVMTGLAFNGLKNHGGYDFSIFNVSAGRSDLLEIDKYAIRIMLNSGVGLGWGESQVRNFLANATW